MSFVHFDNDAQHLINLQRRGRSCWWKDICRTNVGTDVKDHGAWLQTDALVPVALLVEDLMVDVGDLCQALLHADHLQIAWEAQPVLHANTMAVEHTLATGNERCAPTPLLFVSCR